MISIVDIQGYINLYSYIGFNYLICLRECIKVEQKIQKNIKLSCTFWLYRRNFKTLEIGREGGIFLTFFTEGEKGGPEQSFFSFQFYKSAAPNIR